MAYNQNVGYGQGLLNAVSSIVPALGRVFVVVDNDDAGEEKHIRASEVFKTDPDGKVRLFTSLNDAYDACTSNNNDVIVLDGDGTHTITPIDWTKSRIHVIGFDGGGRLVQQGAKVANSSTDDDAYVIKITGVRNSFRNIKFIQSSTNAAALNVAQMGGEGNLYENCSFTFGVVDNLDLTTASEVVCGEDSGTFINCLFGTETLLTSAARTVFTIDQVTASQEFKSNVLKDCIFTISSSSATALLLKVAANTDVLFTNLFINTVFMASVDSAGGVAITNAAESAASLVKGTLNFANVSTFNTTNFMVTSDGVKVTGNVPIASTSGIGVTPA